VSYRTLAALGRTPAALDGGMASDYTRVRTSPVPTASAITRAHTIALLRQRITRVAVVLAIRCRVLVILPPFQD